MPRGPTRDKLSGAEGVPALAARLADLAPKLTALHGEAFLDAILQEFSAWSSQIAPGVPPTEMAARVRKLPMNKAGAVSAAIERVLEGADGNAARVDIDGILARGREQNSSEDDSDGLFLEEPSDRSD